MHGRETAAPNTARRPSSRMWPRHITLKNKQLELLTVKHEIQNRPNVTTALSAAFIAKNVAISITLPVCSSHAL